MPQGDRRGSEVDLYDFTYDGDVKNKYLKDGLGQLTDGDEGHTNFRSDKKGLGVKGFEWVGWKNDTTSMKPITIVFKFEHVRNFSKIMIHCNNLYSKEVRVFRKAIVHFSIGGKYYPGPPVRYNFVRDDYFEDARQVMIRLENKVAKYIKMELYFEARWIMISEVSFESGKHFTIANQF